jgi:alpha-tubulin suppressor-like RCC1 family protein/serine/threonine protein kinase
MMAEITQQRVVELFEAALREEPARRPEFLAEACGSSHELWDELSSLVAEYERRDETVDPPLAWAGGVSATQDSTPGEAQPANLVGRYEAGREIGRGGMGIVYEAYDPVLGRRVALKTIRMDGYGTRSEQGWLRARLLREARTAASLEHSNIVHIYDSGIHGDLAYIAMELVEGPTLERRMAAAPLPSADALNILRQAAAALDYSHAAGVVHRDVKPANIILHRGTAVKIADFSIAKVLSSKQSTWTTLGAGTPSYMSPEQIRGQQVDGRSDQFSLAVVAFELLTGGKPFAADSDFELMKRIAEGDPASVCRVAPHLPASLDGTFQRAFAKDSEDRYATCTEFVCALEEALNAAPASGESAPQTNTQVSGARLASRFAWHWAAAAVVLLVLAWPVGKLVFSKKAPKPSVATASASAPLDARHIVLSQNFEQLVLRTEAYLDHRPGNPNRAAGSFTSRNVPSQVRGIAEVTAIAGGWGNSLAVKSDGTLWDWGWEFLRERRPIIKHSAPIQLKVGQSAPFRSVAGGGEHSLALADDGTVWAWGNNDFAQLGDGTTTSHRAPVRVGGLADVVGIAAGNLYSLALKRDGTVWIWGGDGLAGTILHKVPVEVPALEDVASISTGVGFYIALKKDGSVWAWGSNRDGCLGDGTNKDRATPERVSGLSGVKAVAAGAHHAAALKSDGTVWTWGQNAYGELGDGSLTDHWYPVQVTGLDHVSAIAAGAQHTFALRNDGTVWAWGENSYGVLGDGTWQDRSTPKPVRGLSGVDAIASGGQHGIARKNDGTLWTWGWNEYGQLGGQSVRELGSSGITVKTVNYARSSGPTYALADNGLPWILFDRTARRILLQPGNFATSQWGAALGYDVRTDGQYAIRGAFQRANNSPGAGDGVDVAIFVNDDDAHPLWTRHIGSFDNARTPFSVVAQLRRGQVLRFVVFSGPQGKDGNSDETSLEAAIDQH